MGSLNHPDIPVVSKQNVTFRKHDIKIEQTASADDTKSIITNNRPELNRPLGSGCIVRDTPGGAVADCTQEISWGLYREARSTSARIASDLDAVRNLSVPTSGNMTVAVIETSLSPNTPQTSVRSLGSHIDIRDSVTDEQIASVPSSGVSGPLTH